MRSSSWQVHGVLFVVSWRRGTQGCERCNCYYQDQEDHSVCRLVPNWVQGQRNLNFVVSVSKFRSHFIQHFCRSLKLPPPPSLPKSHPQFYTARSRNFAKLVVRAGLELGIEGGSTGAFVSRPLFKMFPIQQGPAVRKLIIASEEAFRFCRGKFVKTKRFTSKVIENCRPRIRYRITSSSDGKKI